MISLRLVVDTNIVVSAALKPDGLQRTVLLLAITRPARLFVSKAILTEYRDVLSRPEFKIRKGLRQQLLDLPFDPGNPKLQNELGQVLLRKVEKSRVGIRALDASEAKCRVARSRVPWPDAVSRGAIVPTTRPASPDGRKEASGSALDSRSTTAGGGGESRGPGHAGSKTDTSE